jgi:hypothetical protein
MPVTMSSAGNVEPGKRFFKSVLARRLSQTHRPQSLLTLNPPIHLRFTAGFSTHSSINQVPWFVNA